jgi:hypothetical protein
MDDGIFLIIFLIFNFSGHMISYNSCSNFDMWLCRQFERQKRSLEDALLRVNRLQRLEANMSWKVGTTDNSQSLAQVVVLLNMIHAGKS